MENKHDSKSLWKTLKTMGLPSKKTKSSKSIGLKINDEICLTHWRLQKSSTHFSQQLLHLWLKNFPVVLACLVKAMWRIIIRNLEFAKILLLFRLCLKRRSLNIFWNSVPTRPLVWMAFLLDWFIRDSASIVTVPIAHIINLSVITKIGTHGSLVKEKW